jgi:hypothetical protein
MDRRIEIKLTPEMLRALFEGKKVEQIFYEHPLGSETPDSLKITVYPDRYGVLMTWERFSEIQRAANMRAMEPVGACEGETARVRGGF